MAATSSYSVPQHKVFINFRGDELRNNFLAHLKRALKSGGINAFVDEDDGVGKDINDLFQRIQESRIALVIFSSRYTESKWCLNELVKIKECNLVIVPIFYKLDVNTVKKLEGDFGRRFWDLVSMKDHVYKVTEWKEALVFAANKRGLPYDGTRDEREFIDTVIEKIKEVLTEISSKERGPETGDKLMIPSMNISTGNVEKHDDVMDVSPRPHTLPRDREEPEIVMTSMDDPEGSSDESLSSGETEEPETVPLFGSEKRLQQLEQKLELGRKSTRVVGVVGMPGIGKTTLVEMLFRKWQDKFRSRMFFRDIRRKSMIRSLHWMQKTLLQELLKEDNRVIEYTENMFERWKNDLLKREVFIVLDDVDSKGKIEFLLGKLNWVKKGSKIIITTTDKSLMGKPVEDTYVVPRLNERDSLNYFSCHTSDDSISYPQGAAFMSMSRRFVGYAGGNPLALKVLGKELREKDENHWRERLNTLAEKLSEKIQEALGTRYARLWPPEKDAFLDVSCFFRAEDEPFVRSMVDSPGPESQSELRVLDNKFLVDIAGGRVEMHDLMYTFGKELSSQDRRRLWNHGDAIGALKNKVGTEILRGIYLDTSKLPEETYIDSDAFVEMRKLRYLKIYNSQCPRDCGADSKIHFPDGLKLPLEEIRYLHWLRFPLKELPQDFNPKNLIDLRLPYSKIQLVWRDVKDTSKLKWVDLSHSGGFCNLSGLLGASNLQRLDLEGCTSLGNLPKEMQTMKSLVFLNLRGCTSLQVVEEMNMESLKTLILSDCSNLEEFRVISESLETLYLDGTAIKQLPPSMEKLQKLVLLNLRCCKMLKDLPDSLGSLKCLHELILSGCSKLESFPEVLENMKCLEILLCDGTAIKEMPKLRPTKKINTSSPNIFPPQSRNNMIPPNILPPGIRNTMVPPMVLPPGIRNTMVPPMVLPPGIRNNTIRNSGRDTRGISAGPRVVNRFCLLRHLCLSKNDMIRSLQVDISELYHLKWLELKYCKNLTSLPMLPPNLQRLDAHGCDKLKTVANPLSLLLQTEQSNSAFIFTDCNNLEQDTKDKITSYAQKRSHLMSDAVIRYDRGSVSKAHFRISFPGCEVPSWFVHREVGSEITPTLPSHWCDERLSGIALCAVISFQDYRNQYDSILVKCTCKFRTEDRSWISFSFTVGEWTKPGKIEQDHVFIGYTSCSHITKRLQEQSSKCIPAEAVLEFEVTDGTMEAEQWKVVKCGFSFMKAEPGKVPSEPNYYQTPKSGLSEKAWHALGVFLLGLFVVAPQHLLSTPMIVRVIVALVLYSCLVDQ
ncbi:PREDICTED: disease resistance protein LAZ5-like [Tarenaya hassleriana]|uniref:disease resistance protein LAZ5-like n=1 Tax=Tarenaya hassleriana TaxID=28532 RepID=UPI00053C6BEA|nr:PREDICTED: disease resistance protein LAZ5-like [Tarenaya hassleriana]